MLTTLGIILSAVIYINSFNLTSVLWGKYCYIDLTDEETKALRS